RLGLLRGVVAPFEPSVGAARERLAAACAQHPLALLLDDAERSQDWLEAMLLAIVRDPAWKRRPLLVVAVTNQPIDAPERMDLLPLTPAVGKAKLIEALGPRPWAVGLRFTQLALLRVAEHALTPGERTRAHLRAAEMSADVGARAHHLFRAKATGVIRAALAAARKNLCAGDPLPAARLYQIAQAALRQPLFSARAAVLCERAGDCLALAGAAAEARFAYARALGRGGIAARIWQKIAK